MLSYKLVIELIDKPNFQAFHQEVVKVVYTLISNLASKLTELSPNELYFTLTSLPVSQLASLICVLSSNGARGYTAHPAINPVVSSLIEQLARRVAKGSFGPAATPLAGILVYQLNPNADERLSPDKINQVAYNLASLLAYETVYQPTLQPTTLVTPQSAPKTTTQLTTPQATTQPPTPQAAPKAALHPHTSKAAPKTTTQSPTRSSTPKVVSRAALFGIPN
jgi:hypothetical protein